MKKPNIVNLWMALAAVCLALIAGACSVQEPGSGKGRGLSIPTPSGEVLKRLPRAPGAMERGGVRARRAWEGGMLRSQSAPVVPAGIHASAAPPRAAARRSPAPGEELWIIATRPRRVPATEAGEPDHPGSGALVVKPQPGKDDQTEVPLPLKHTDVRAAITGYVGTVDVTQQFGNPFDRKIEAVYLFHAASLVRSLTSKIGTATSVRREFWDAAEIYPSHNPDFSLTPLQRETLGLFSEASVG